jgi:23S rRNA (uridine2552-2'-O)-methyltransferase
MSDPFVAQARRDGYIARSAYKLLHIDERFQLFNPQRTAVVVDLGAAPGGWCQVVRRRCRADTVLIGVDLSPLALQAAGVRFLQGDFRDAAVLHKLNAALSDQGVAGAVDVVLTDMCPDRSGDAADRHISATLNIEAYRFALEQLRLGGHFVGKLIGGDTYHATLLQQARRHFEIVHLCKPPASRAESDERFVVALRKLAAPREAPLLGVGGRPTFYELDAWPGAVSNRGAGGAARQGGARGRGNHGAGPSRPDGGRGRW